MKKIIYLLWSIIVISSCNSVDDFSSINPENWTKRTITFHQNDSLLLGETYLSVYSEIYSTTEERTHNLTATISMRNTNRRDSIFITKAEYFDTKGKLIRTYFDKPIYLSPMETVEIVIDERDKTGGTGANFLFEWRIPENVDEPLFEAVMISTSGTQGLSFSTSGKNKLLK